MLCNLLTQLFGGGRVEDLVSIDIGSANIKLMEIEYSGDSVNLKNAAVAPSPAGAIKNNVIVRPDEVANAIRALVEANGISAKHVVTALPGPAVFSKKINLNRMSEKELRQNIQFEAGNYIPHKLNAVHLDYQVLSSTDTSMEILLVAVKNEIIESFIQTIELAGLVLEIADVDSFALENMFELDYPEDEELTVALVNVGSRYSSINILSRGVSLFTGDVSVGGRLYTDALCETLDLKPPDAEKAKMGDIPEGMDENLIAETIDRTTEHVTAELHRQLGFFWTAAATDKPIEKIYLCGGGSQLPGLLEELSAKTGIPVELVDTFRKVNCVQSFDKEYLKEIGPSMSVSVGLALRRDGDKVHSFE
ncbi:MAG: type IV pilus assembly protein PilM [Bdellovibrionales bacterium]|nr:type IV pilus assembly protein PilM [Bdellovibrionales bacterium]